MSNSIKRVAQFLIATAGLNFNIPTADGKSISKEQYAVEMIDVEEVIEDTIAAIEEKNGEENNEVPEKKLPGEFSRAHRKFKSCPISNDTNFGIMAMSGGNDILCGRFRDLVIRTRPFIEYTLYYMSNSGVKLLTDLDKETRELINGIASIASPEFGKIYENDEIANLEKYQIVEWYNPYYEGKFLLSYADIREMMSDDFVENMRARWSELHQSPKGHTTFTGMVADPTTASQITVPYGRVGRFDGNGYYHPAFQFVNTEQDFNPDVKPEGMDDELFNRLELVLSNLLPENRKHFYEFDPMGNVYITTYTGPFDKLQYLLDTGRVMGGTHISIQAFYPGMGSLIDIFVDVNVFPKIARKILNSNFYIMDQVETQAVINTLYSSQIYRNIDLTNTSFMDKYTSDDKVDFAASASKILDIIHKKDMGNTKFRVIDYITPHQFTLVSDKECQMLVTPGMQIMEGVKYTVDGDIVIENINGKEVRYNAIQ